VVSNALPNRIFEIDEVPSSMPDAPSRSHASTLHAPPLFQDVSDLLRHKHHEEPFDDFALQPLLPNRLSQLAPGVSWCDLAGDGWEDLIIGSGRGGKLSAFHNDGHGHFQPLTDAPFNPIVTLDQP